MLKLIKIKDPSLKWRLLHRFNPEKDCFIVSDIKTKSSIELELLKNHAALPGLCVLRANEFYKELSYQLEWGGSFASDSFIKELFADFCSESSSPWVQNLQSSQGFFDFFKAFFPIWMHTEGADLVQEKLEEQKQSVFKPWFELSRRFFQRLRDKNIFPESAVKSVLFNHLSAGGKKSFEKERLFVDVGFSLDFCEKEIFQELSRYKEICILAPELENQFHFEPVRSLYEVWEESVSRKQVFSFDSYFSSMSESGGAFGQNGEKDGGFSPPRSAEPSLLIDESPQTAAVKKNIEDLKGRYNEKLKDTRFYQAFSQTQVEEIRRAVSQVQKWLKSGAAQKDIALFAPYMENYWTVLKSYLEREGLFAQKSLTAPLSSFQEIKYFLSALRLHLNKFSFEDLEYFCFYKESKKDFSDFKIDYYKVPNRKSAAHVLFKGRSLPPGEKITGRRFIKWALSFWPKEADLSSWNLTSAILQKFPREEELPPASWLSFLESEILKKEKELAPEPTEGIACLSFNAFYSVNRPYVFILGLTEESLKSSFSGVLRSLSQTQTAASSARSGSSSHNGKDLLTFLQDIGFSLSIADPKETENSLLWFLQSSALKEVYLSCPVHNFSGEVQTKSLIYMLSDKLFAAKKDESKEEPSWERRRRQKDLETILDSGCIKKENADNLKKFFEDQAASPKFYPKDKISLSSGSLKKYTDCPFKYAAEKLFFSKEKQNVERELSPLSKGSKAHELFEMALKKYPDLEITEDQKEALLESLKPAGRELIHEKQWIIVKDYFKRLLEAFLEKEREKRSQFPLLKPKAFEAEIAAFWDQEKGDFNSQKGDKDFLKSKELYLFKGRIDRIDAADNETKGPVYALIDYKSSDRNLVHISSWAKEGSEDLQMALYARALQKGLAAVKSKTENQRPADLDCLPPGKIEALFYSIYNDDFSAKGFEDKAGSLRGIMGERKGHQQDQAALEAAVKASLKLTQSVVKSMEEGLFRPQPKDKTICKKCFYRKWCRIDG